ncbi:hypothetical protein ACQUW5_14365, partial [Legionella sp. CNM-1927-20]|uniref:hypothetical protein n=1 Tax=Legionella sp. CNM-1927-20 TaxID=3422221 RepID=UPI00403A7C9A
RKTPTSKAPNKVWVYEGTGDIYTGLPPSTVTSTKNRRGGEVLKGQVEVEGQIISVEYITKKAQAWRQKEPNMVWVYEGTGDIYTGLPPSTVTSTKNCRGGEVLKGQVEVEGQIIFVEYITKVAQKKRQKEPDMVWVYEGTGNIYTGLPPSNVTSTRNHKRSEVMKGQVEVQGQAITVEYITKKAQTWRQKEPDMVWVYEGTGNIHAGLPPSSATSTKNHMGGEVLKGQVEVDGQTFSVEYITKHAQKKRQKEPDMVWVYEGTGDIYTGLPPSAVTSTKNCRGGEVQKGLVEIQGQIIFVEYITKHAQKKRQKEPDMVWVYEGTGDIYTGLLPSTVTSTKNRRGGEVQKGQVEVDGQTFSVEYITKAAQTLRLQRELKQQPQPKKRKRNKENNAETLPIDDNCSDNRDGDVEIGEYEQGLSDEQAYSQQGFNGSNTLNELNGYVAYSPYGFFAQSPPRLNQQDSTVNTNTELQDSLEEVVSSL